MTRARQTISIGLLVSSVRFFADAPDSGAPDFSANLFMSLQLYLALYLQLVPFGPKIQDQIVPVLPFWALVSFGAYLLFKLGWGVYTFNDVPEAHAELMKEIKIAKKELKSKGIELD
ncbi:dolichol phosphate mannosyltransferase subunit 3 [Lasallia pustulata]|uniref:Dolichol-phosphate mannosyltransferase subunit 3 n=1 Tax=Lasallia pustulata TaxID=136370 RepID=A0A1W5D2K7_9LECA|nr:dolichol phosphate mannosyltransferase subunit 3 [Lasallia pustulata]